MTRDWPFILRRPLLSGALTGVAMVIFALIAAPPLAWLFGQLDFLIEPLRWWVRYWLP